MTHNIHSHPRTLWYACLRTLLALVILSGNIALAYADPLVIGIFPRRDAAVTAKYFQPLADYLTKALDRQVILEMSPDFDTFLSRLDNVITSYSIHYTKLYELSDFPFKQAILSNKRKTDGDTRSAGRKVFL